MVATRRSRAAQPLAGEPITLRWTNDGRSRYYVRVNIGVGPDGTRRQQRSSHDTLTAARAEVARIRTDRERGVLLERSRQTVGEAADEWLAARKVRVRRVTYAGYEAMVAGLKNEFGGKRLASVTKADVQRFVNRLVSEGKARATTGRYLFVMRSIFSDSIDAGVLARNPAARVEPSGRDAKPRRALSASEIAKVRQHFTNDPLFACWLLTLYGLRRSEVLGLRWSDIDLVGGTVAISQSRVAIDGKSTETGPTKTRRGTRTLPMPADLLVAMREMREAQAAAFGFEHVRSGYVAVDAIGAPMRHERWTDLWAKACRAQGVTVVPLHSARHTSVSLMRDAGIPDHVVAHWHGHDEAVMRSVYSHADDEGLAAAGAALGGLLAGHAPVLSANSVPTTSTEGEAGAL
jgi:integrase